MHENKKYKKKLKIFTKKKWTNYIIDTRQVTKVLKGGRINRTRSIGIIGNHNGIIGYGMGKNIDATKSNEQAIKKAKKNLFHIKLSQNFTIPYTLRYKYKACQLYIQPGLEGLGLITNNKFRQIFELVGIRNIRVKQLGSKNILNNIKTLFLALKTLS